MLTEAQKRFESDCIQIGLYTKKTFDFYRKGESYSVKYLQGPLEGYRIAVSAEKSRQAHARLAEAESQ
jgi:hypothetical protein